MALTDVGVLVLRVGVGGTIAAHGAQKLFGWFGGGGVAGTGQFFESVGFVPGPRNARLAGLTEGAGGALMALGLASGPAGAAVAGNMIVASAVHYPAFFNTSGGLELPATYGLVGAVLGSVGPGRYSLDEVTGHALNKPWMTAVGLVSAVGAAAFMLRQRSRVLAARPTEPTETAVEGAQGGGSTDPS